MDPSSGIAPDDALKTWMNAKRKSAKAKAKKKAKRSKKTVKRKPAKSKKAGSVARSERLDMRLTKAEKARVTAKAKKTRRTVTSLVIEAIEKIR